MIRDDDISYFTTTQELEKVWSKWYGKIDILFAVTPFMVENKEYTIKGREFNCHQLGDKEFDIADNGELIKYLKDLIKKGYIQIGLHGYNHKYMIENDTLIAEFNIKNEKVLYEKSLKAKEYLEKLLNTKIDIFIPPDNAISKEAIKALSKAGFKKVLRAFPLKYIDTKFSVNYVKFFLKRIYFKLKYNLVYSQSYFNGYLIEEASYLYKGQDSQKLLNDYKIYRKYNLPFTITTHYWELKSEKKENLYKFLEKVCIEK